MTRDVIQRKNRAYAALANADAAIAIWRHRHFSRTGYHDLPAGWAERRAELARAYAAVLGLGGHNDKKR